MRAQVASPEGGSGGLRELWEPQVRADPKVHPVELEEYEISSPEEMEERITALDIFGFYADMEEELD